MTGPTNDPHTPAPEFVASLREAVLNANKAQQPPRTIRWNRIAAVAVMAAAAVVLLAVGLAVGSAAGFASAEPTGTHEPPSPLAALKSVPIRDAITVLTGGTPTKDSASTSRQQGIPIYSLTPSWTRSTTSLGAILGLRELPDGHILVNDAGRKQLRVFDSTLTSNSIGLDSVAGGSNSYGSYPASIMPYIADSTLFSSVAERTALILDRYGHVARALALPTYQDGVTPFAVPFPAPAGVDDKGRVIGESGFRVMGGVVADSTLIMRADLDTRQVDVIGASHSATGRNRNDPPENGNRVVTTIRQPVPMEDSWAVLSSGTVGFVRSADYHVDWVFSNGTKTSTSKLPYDWKRLTDEDKQKLADSAKVVWDSLMTIRNRRMATPPRPRGDGSSDDGGNSGRSSGGAAAPGQQGSIQHIESVPISEIPDFYPPIRRKSAIADRDGNLWILPNTSAQSQHGELVYDVVNPEKGLFMRARLPVGRSIAGFGKGGIVFLEAGDRTNGFFLERTKLDRK